MGTPTCQSVYPVNVLGTPTCLSVHPINDMGTHQYRLCTQLTTETLLLISKYELLVFMGTPNCWSVYPVNVRGTPTCLSVYSINCVPN